MKRNTHTKNNTKLLLFIEPLNFYIFLNTFKEKVTSCVQPLEFGKIKLIKDYNSLKRKSVSFFICFYSSFIILSVVFFLLYIIIIIIDRNEYYY